MSADIDVERRDRVATVTLQRPPINGLTPELVAELDRLRAELETDESVGAVVLQSGLESTFSAGADATWIAQRCADIGAEAFVPEFEAFTADLTAFAHAVHDSRVVWIAAIGGHCIAGGLELALACDMRVCAQTGVRFALPELGMFGAAPTGGGALQYLVRAAGRSRTMHLIVTGERFEPAAALEWRLVDEVVPRENLSERASSLATSAARPAVSQAMSGVKAALRGSDMPLDDARALDRTRFVNSVRAPAFARGLREFAQKFGRKAAGPTEGRP
ncbi:MAG: enoyl-CoA hydratase-related protein [Candidatus Velthaea sp.]